MTAPRKPARAVLAAIAMVLLQGCGGSGGPGSVLTTATSRIGEIRAGSMYLRFTLAPLSDAAAGTVGVLMRGSFALDRHRRLPVLHIAYTRLAGTRSVNATIDSSGQSATISTAGRTIPLEGQQQQLLAATLQGPQGLGNLPLHLDRWVDGPRQTAGPLVGGQPTDRITGNVDLPRALGDLNQISSGGVGRAVQSSNDARLEKIVRSSSFVALVGHRDHLLRRLSLRVVLAPAGAAAQGLTIALDLALSPRSVAG